MNLNPLNLFKKNSTGYIGLLLRETDGVIMYLEVDPQTQNLEKIDSEKFSLSSRWDHLTDDVDDALYKLEVRTKKTFDEIIFFVYSHLVEPNTHEIKKQHLASIKNLVKSMELKPLGFIEVNEAYLKQYLDVDKTSFSSIVVESDATTLTIFTYQSGELVSQIYAQRKKSFISDLSEAFMTIKDSTELPEKIILLPTKDYQDGADLIEHSWDEKIFSQQPIITTVTEEEMTERLINAFSNQIRETSTVEEINEPEHKAVTEDSMQEKMGFVIGGEINNEDELIRPTYLNPISRIINSIKSRMPELKQQISGWGIFRSRKMFIHSSIILGAVLIILGISLIEVKLHKAVVTMTLPSQKLELSKSFSAKSLGLKQASQEAKFDARVTASGVKNVGQPAKGTVTIYNSSLSQSKSFPKGTTLVGPGSLSFTLDTDVKLASASGDAIDIVSSSAKSSVTASAIGPESNFASGTKFSVADESSSSVIAKAETAFTGGTRSQIQVVSEKDLDKAKSLIVTKAQNFIQTNVSKKLGSEAFILKPLTTITTISQDADNEVGTEAGSVELNSKVNIDYSYISNDKLKDTLVKSFQSKLQKDLSLPKKNISFKVVNINTKNGNTQISVNASGRAIPPVTEDEILNSIKGKTVGSLQSLSKEKYRAQSIEFTIEHPIDFLKNLLPIFTGNIKLRLLYP